MKRLEWIRTAEPEELAAMIAGNEAPWCGNLAQCGEDLIADREIPEERCWGCVQAWLEQEVGCEECAQTRGSPVDAGCERCLGGDDLVTVVEQYSRQPDGSIAVKRFADVEDVMELVFPTRVDALVKALIMRIRNKIEDAGPWSRAEVETMEELLGLLEGCGLLDAFMKDIRRKKNGFAGRGSGPEGRTAERP